MMQRPQAVSSTLMRASNLGLVLRLVADGRPMSRAQIAAATDLTKATVSKLVDLLITGNLLTDVGPGAETVGAGRPGSLLKLSSLGPVAIGLEMNVDYVASCVVDFTGAVRGRELVLDNFRHRKPDAVLTTAAAMLRRAVDRAAADGLRIAGVGVGVPGLVETSGEVVRVAPNLGWRDVAVIDLLRAKTGLTQLPMRLDNEANLAASGELWSRQHPGLESFVLVFAEAGVGAGIVLHGELVRGANGLSGEIGHVCVNPNGVACACGASGCLEAEAGQERILELAGIVARPGTTIGRPEGPLEELLARALARDRQAVASIEAAGVALGIALANVINIIDINTVVLGGIYAALAPWLQPSVQRELNDRVIGSAWMEPTILVSALGGEAAVRGGALSVLRGVVEDPSGFLG